jgi:SulP family sulfate permease
MIRPVGDRISLWPFLSEWRTWTRRTLRLDLQSGVTVALFAVPQAMAYAVLAGMSPGYGLHTAIVMSIVAALWGSSPFVNTGPTNSSALLAAGVLAAGAAPDRVVLLAFHLTLLVGAVRLAMGLLRVGRLVRFVPQSAFLGFMTGAGFLIAFGQIHHLLGVPSPRQSLFLARMADVLSHLRSANVAAAGIGVGVLVAMLALDRYARRWPVALGVVLAATLAAEFLGPPHPVLRVRDLVPLPRSLPEWHAVPLQVNLLIELLPTAFAVGLVGLIEAVSIGDLLALKHRQRLNVNQEFFGQGLGQLAAAFFHGFPGSGSFSRSGLIEQTGGQTRLANVFFGLATAAMVVLLPGLLDRIPVAALSGLLLYIGVKLVDVHRLRLVQETSGTDLAVLALTFLTTVFVRIEFGLFVGVLAGMAFFLQRAAGLKMLELLPAAGGHFDETAYEPGSAHARSDVVALSVHGDLFFGLAETLREQLDEVLRLQRPRFIILRLRRAFSIDYSCWAVIFDFAETFRASGGRLLLCGVAADLVNTIRHAGADAAISPRQLFAQAPTPFRALEAAIDAVREQLPPDATLAPAWAARLGRPAGSP